MTYPQIVIARSRLAENIRQLCSELHPLGIEVALVVKSTCAHPEIIRLANSSPADLLADARLQNLAAIKSDKPKMLLRIAMPDEVQDTVRLCDISLQSEIVTIRALGQAAEQQQRRHKVILMIDVGDLREGVFFSEQAAIFAAAEAVLACPWLELYGVGTNLSCFGGVIPDHENTARLLQVAQMLRQRYHIPLPVVSAGASTSLLPLLGGKLPEGITQLRLGESWLDGLDPTDELPLSRHPKLSAMHTDACTLRVQLIEVQQKPSVPLGNSGNNAFGESVRFPERGPMRRGVCAIGRQDTETTSLFPLDPAVEILGASSDHMLVNLTDCHPYQVGDILEFRMGYGAILRAFTSPYVEKLFID